MNQSKIFIKNTVKLSPKDSPYNIGIDIKAISYEVIGEKVNGFYRSIDYIEYETNLYTHPATEAIESCQTSYSIYNCHTDLRPRSSISKYNIVLANSVGLIDRGYRNQILVRFF